MRKPSLVAFVVLAIAALASVRTSAQVGDPGQAASPVPAAAASDFYVSPSGSDSNPGTQAAPWKTIQKAAGTVGPGATVHILPGVYRESTITPEYSGTATARITYKAENGPGTVFIRGSEPSASLSWTRLASNTIGLPTGVDPANVYYADLSSWGLAASQYRNIITGPRSIYLMDANNQVLRRLPMARAPNWTVATPWKYAESWWTAEGGAYVETCNPETNADHNCDYLSATNTSRSFYQIIDRSHLTAAGGLGSLIGGTLRVQDNRSGHYLYRVDITGHDQATGALSTTHKCEFDGGSNFPALGWGSKYFVENKPQLLDEPGEWWYDTGSKRLYLWAPGSVNPGTLNLEISRRDDGISLNGVSYITLDGLTVEFHRRVSLYATYKGKHNLVTNTSLRYGNYGLWIEVDSYATTATDSQIYGFTFTDSELAYMDSEGFRSQELWADASGNLTINPAAWRQAFITDTTMNGNDIHHIGFYADGDDSIGGAFWFANNVRFTNNYVHDIAHNGIGFFMSVIQPATTTRGWGFLPSEIKTGNNLIAGNIFERACLVQADCGGLKFWGSTPDAHVFRDTLVTGNTFRDNTGWTHILEKRQVGPDAQGLYLDFASGLHAYRNTAYNNSFAGYYFFGTWRDGEIIYHNNIAANGTYGVVLADPIRDSHGNYNTQFVNTIVINNSDIGFSLYRGYSDWGNLKIDNNLYYENGWSAPKAMRTAVNYSSYSTYPSLRDIQANTAWEDFGAEGDPYFASYNVSDHSKALGVVPDLHLTADSSNAIDKGTTALPPSLADLLTKFGITDTRNGVAYDIGAYEFGSVAPPAPTFADVPFEHPFHDDIEILYQNGYTAGCATDPLRYCPDLTMNRAESSVFVERGIHTASYDPPPPTSQTFADMPLDSWAAKWVEGLWADHYTAGCGTNPLVYCPWQGHTRAEGCVFYLRMLNSPDFTPPQPTQQVFADVPLDTWYAGWVQGAYDAGLLEPCATSPELRLCPNDPLTRALAAHMMVKAKGLETVEAATVVAKWKDNRKAAFTFTFDDSNSSEAAIGLPYLIRKGLVASWYIVPGKSSYTTGTSCGYGVYGDNCNCSSDNCSLSPPYDCPCWVCKDLNCFKSWEQEAVNSGQDLANHTWEHGWTSCEDADLKIKMTADYIRNLTEKPEHSLQGFEYPGSGTSNCSASSIFAILEKYYLVKKTDIRTAGSVYPDMDEADEMAAFVTNLISDGDWRGLNFESLLPGSGFSPVKCSEFEAFVDWLTTKQDELWIGTHLDVYKYQNERNAAQVTVLESTTSRISLNLTLTGEPIPPANYPAWDWDWSLFDYPLTLITDVPSSWDACEITQGTQTKTYPVSGGKVMYDALPNGGEILLRPAGHSAAGCGTNPLVYCPWQGHNRAEGCVFYLRMLNSPDFTPPAAHTTSLC